MMGNTIKFMEAINSLLIGLKTTIRRVNMPEVTIRYPYEKPDVGDRFRGAPMIKGIITESDDVTTFGKNTIDYNSEVQAEAETGRLAQCIDACPAHVDVRGYIKLIAARRYKDALDLIRERCTLPASIGRVCTQPCEVGCHRNYFDEPLAIRDLKRFAADTCKDMPFPEPIPKTKDKTVGIIGAGPAGLTAAQNLAKLGYPVTIYDMNPEGGGTLLMGIPVYRLPKDALKWDVDAICALGVDLQTNIMVGKDIKFDALCDAHDVVLIATGLPACHTLGVEGEDAEGVLGCLALLQAVNFDLKPSLGKAVAVVGGGNAAMDGARTALRIGAEKVYLVYRRSLTEMPARTEEINEAQEESIEFHLQSNPTRILVENNKVIGIECIKMGLGEPDESGRRRPEPIKGSEYTLDVNTVVVAIGQKTNLNFLKETRMARDERGDIIYDPVTMQTSIEKVFVAGEVVTGAGAAIEAIASGHEASESIHRFLQGQDLKKDKIPQVAPKRYKNPKPYLEGIGAKRRRVHARKISMAERVSGFKEVEFGLKEEEALREANRCLLCNCEKCSVCEMCARTCPMNCIEISNTQDLNAVNYSLDLTKCMFCGLCSEVCPSRTLVMSKDYENSEIDKNKLFYDTDKVRRGQQPS